MAFDIDAKIDASTGVRPTDALEFAEAIREYIGWKGFCIIQPSTSGYGAYVYFILNYDGNSASQANWWIKRLCRVVYEALQGRFQATVDAIKGDIPIISKKDGQRAIVSQGNLVRLPRCEDLAELEALKALKAVPLVGVIQFVELESKTLKTSSSSGCEPEAEASTGEEPGIVSPSLSLSSSPKDVLVHGDRGHTGEKKLSKDPLARVYEGLKSFRDAHQRDPAGFEEFNKWYEAQNLNTEDATKERKKRYELALKRLGPYSQRKIEEFDEASYAWVEKYVTENDLKTEGQPKKLSLKMIELKVTQYVIGLATAYPQKGSHDFGCPINRLGKMHDALHSKGILPKPFGRGGKNKYGCYVRVLEARGLIEVVEDAAYRKGLGRRMVVTERDEVFGQSKADRIAKGRKKTLKTSPGGFWDLKTA